MAVNHAVNSPVRLTSDALATSIVSNSIWQMFYAVSPYSGAQYMGVRNLNTTKNGGFFHFLIPC